ncbi:MAG: twin-arginine translocase TatA/TatE family subunit [Actinobacteria bacterium]|nr:twin-arginine translocase TatA/TatE family subunit [Actinomycetota bacterium]
MFGSFGWMELLLVLVIVLIIFGAGKIPQLGEGLGKAIKGFKKSVNEPDTLDVTASTQEGPPSGNQPAGQQQVGQAPGQEPPPGQQYTQRQPGQKQG